MFNPYSKPPLQSDFKQALKKTKHKKKDSQISPTKKKVPVVSAFFTKVQKLH